MKKIINKFFKLFIDFLVFIIAILIFFSLYNLISFKVLDRDYTSIFGYSVFEIASGSMEPVLSVGDLIVVRATDDFRTNDIVTYTENNDFITHRVINIANNYVITKGDANNSVDYKIKRDRVIGKVVFTIPNGGTIRKILLTPSVMFSIIIALIMISLCFSYIPRRKKKGDNLDEYFEDSDLRR